MHHMKEALIALNHEEVDRTVRFFFVENQPAEVENMWHDITRSTSGKQRKRLLGDVLPGFLPISPQA